MADDPYRLPRTVIPTRYDLVLEPTLAEATFSGSVTVSVEVREPTAVIVLNAAELEIDEASVDGLGPVTVELDGETERCRLRLDAPIAVGAATVRLAFRGTLNDKLRGFYRSTYQDAAGRSRTVATTQMQPTDCRRAFPCWDEPDFKAVFATTLIVEEGNLAISNTREVGREPLADRPGTVAVRFADTMPMSTYLVAFVVGPLEATPWVDAGGVPMRIVHVPGKGHLTGFGLEIGAAALAWFQDYYGIPYPSDKVDMVALPDFAAGAMENLGCVTYRENLLLVDPATGTTSERQVLADVVAHELAHMWFGDLVTMRWWNGIWLNEAFATFMEVAAIDVLRPDWERWVSFNLSRTTAFDIDSLSSTRAIEFEVVSPSDAEGMFDVLTYEKGAALLRMLQQYLGEDGFRNGVRRYLTRHSYGCTETSDLWDDLEAATGEPVRRIMDSWIWQQGHPLVTAHLSGDEVVIGQSRFLFSGEDSTSYVVPLLVRQQHGEDVRLERVLLEDRPVRLPLLHQDAVVVVNAGAHGFLRVAYDRALGDRLRGADFAGLSTPERYAVVDDLWAATVAGHRRAADFLRLAEGCGSETELPVWTLLLNGLRAIGRVLEGAALEAFRGRVRHLVEPALGRLGWEPRDGERDLDAQLRAALVSALAVLGQDPAAQATARALHERILQDPTAVEPNLAAACTAVVAACGTAADFAVFVERFRSAGTPQEQLRYLYALAEFPGVAEFDATLALARSGEVRTQNAPYLLARAIAHRDHGARAFRFVREHWSELLSAFPSNTHVRMVDPVKLLSRPHEVAEARAFFSEHPIPQGAKTLEQILERQSVNAALRAREADDLAQALTS
ncbi:MAG: M1 family metallopeptidase [Acidimicrobiales bacterium]